MAHQNETAGKLRSHLRLPQSFQVYTGKPSPP